MNLIPRLTLPVVVLIAVLAPTAHAATVDRAGDVLTFTGAGEVNDVQLYNEQLRSGSIELVVHDRGGTPVTPTDAARAAGCRQYVYEYDQDATPDPQRVICPSPAAVRVDLNAGDDRVFISTSLRETPAPVFPMQVDGGPGDDRLFGGPLNDAIRGGDGNDTLDAGAGDDTLHGEGGNDELDNGDGNDVLDGGDGDDLLTMAGATTTRDGADSLIGGAGIDELSYWARTSRIDVTFDGQANDGKPADSVGDAREPNEGDNVASDFEVVRGGTGDDHLTGDERPNVLLGGTGTDTLRGGPGTDLLDGERGGDLVYGDAGDDRLMGAVGSDFLSGGPGSDDVEGRGPISVRDQERDVVRCLSTAAKVIADKLDEISGPCGSIQREKPAPETKIPDRFLYTAPRGFTTEVLAKYGFFVRARCRTGCTIIVRALIAKKLARRLGLSSRLIGAARGTFAPGNVRLRVRLNGKAAKRLQRVPKWQLILRGRAFSGTQTFRINASFPVPTVRLR